jgi:hypothetical protein
VEDPAPRDPFRCEERALPPGYDTYVRNAVFFMDRHPTDTDLADWVRSDLRWYVKDELGRWVKNGVANDVDAVITRCRAEIAQLRIDLARLHAEHARSSPQSAAEGPAESTA